MLLAQACNIGLKAVARPDVPALSLSRLSWVQQNYVRAESIAAANARLVEAQLDLPLAQLWDGGEVALADGVRFVVPIKTISAGWNSEYFGSQRGVTYYNFTSDQFTGFHGIVIPGTLRDSLFILAGLLEQQTQQDETYGRRILVQLNRGEGRHAVASTVAAQAERGHLRRAVTGVGASPDTHQLPLHQRLDRFAICPPISRPGRAGRV